MRFYRRLETVPIKYAFMTIRCAAYEQRLSFGSIPIINQEGIGLSLALVCRGRFAQGEATALVLSG